MILLMEITAVRGFYLLNGNVLVLPTPIHMLKILLLINHIDSNGTAHGNKVKQMYIGFYHNLVFIWLAGHTMQHITAS